MIRVRRGMGCAGLGCIDDHPADAELGAPRAFAPADVLTDPGSPVDEAAQDAAIIDLVKKAQGGAGLPAGPLPATRDELEDDRRRVRAYAALGAGAVLAAALILMATRKKKKEADR